MMNAQFLLILQREFYTRVRKRSFLVMTILGPLITASIMILAVWLSLRDDERHKILVVDDNYPAFKNIKDEKDLIYTYANISLVQAQKMFFESDYTGILYLPKNILASNASKLYVKKMPSATAQRRIEKQVEKIIEEQKMMLNNIQPEVYAKINTTFNLTPFQLQEHGGETEINTEQAYVGYVLAMFIYIFIFMYGVQVMRGVIEEKTNRILEVMVCSVRPFQLMMGKILGLALVGLFQLLLWIVMTGILFTVLQMTFFKDYYDPSVIQHVQMTEEVAKAYETEQLTQVNLYDPNNIINRIQFSVIIPLFLIYFIGGYLLYAALFAAIGAMVDNETDTQQFILPVTVPLILAIIVSQGIVRNPEGETAFWFSMIPLTSPIVMMIRIAVGVGSGSGLPIWQVALSVCFLIGGFLLATWVGAKLYRTGILMYGKKPSYKDVWRWFLQK